MQNGSPGVAKSGSGSQIEKMYQTKSDHEHILLSPDTYIGAVEHTKEFVWVFNKEENKMIQKELTFVPGLYKIYDQILVNAAEKAMSCIKVDIDSEKNVISIWNNGPVVMHKEEKMYVPAMIFGHLFTSSNYNEDEENGYGANLCNIFSTSFTVETASSEYGKSFRQSWGFNMSKATEPEIKDFNGDDFTKVTFSPDLAKFEMDRLDDDIVALMSRRAYDVAASTRGVAVYLNGSKIPVENFKDYVDLYLKGGQVKLVYEKANERWEVAAALSHRGFQQVSFVNSIATTKGGRHVDHVVDSIVKQLIDVLEKKNKSEINIKSVEVRNHLWVFINCLIVNPTFDSQRKEEMTLQANKFESKCVLSEKFIQGVSKSGIVQSALSWAKFKAQNDLAKTSGEENQKITRISQLDDAHDAGSKNGHLCTLLLIPQYSSKLRYVVSWERYGVFCLQGKLLNVRKATNKQILENAKINNLIKILGLQYEKKYLTIDDLKSLRYGKVMMMTNQDHDGAHFKGLFINFIHTYWPELLRLPFLEHFITPIVQATKENEKLSFYSLPEFEQWKSSTKNSHTYKIRHYRGLPSWGINQMRENFENIDMHRISFKYEGSQDDDSILMAFAKTAIDQRKNWLTKHMDETKRRKLLGLPERNLHIKGKNNVSYTEFVNMELVLFFNAGNVHRIPCLVDGFKSGQRKIMYTCFKRNYKEQVNVESLAYGDKSRCKTIVHLAQDFVGSNNINLLEPRSYFGCRLEGRNFPFIPHHLYTLVSPLTRLIFHPHDDPLLNYEVVDYEEICPTWYIPIIPMVLVNGAEGIGTGWSAKIPNHNPRDIIKNIRQMIFKKEPVRMDPWYKNFRGSIEYISEHRYTCNGIVSISGHNQVEITELPIGIWTQSYIERVLKPLLYGSKKVRPIISDYKEYHDTHTVRFLVTFIPGEFNRLHQEEGGFHRIFKLTRSWPMTQMHAVDHANCLRRFDTSTEILKEFFPLRLEYYKKRKNYLMGLLQAEADQLTEQARFIVEKCDRTIIVENDKLKSSIDELIRRGYRPDPVKEWRRKIKVGEEEIPEDEEETPEDEEEEPEAESSTSVKKEKAMDPEKAFQKLSNVKKFDYLLQMPAWMLTEEGKNELPKQRDQKLAELIAIKAKTPKMMWLDDLDALENKLDEIEEEERLKELGFTKYQAKALMSNLKASEKRKFTNQGNDLFPSPKRYLSGI